MIDELVIIGSFWSIVCLGLEGSYLLISEHDMSESGGDGDRSSSGESGFGISCKDYIRTRFGCFS